MVNKYLLTYLNLAKIWIFNRKIKFKVTCLPVKSGEL